MGYVLIEYLLTHASQRSSYNALHIIAVRTKFQPDKEVVVRTTSRIGKFAQKVTTALQVVPFHEHAQRMLPERGGRLGNFPEDRRPGPRLPGFWPKTLNNQLLDIGSTTWLDATDASDHAHSSQPGTSSRGDDLSGVEMILLMVPALGLGPCE